MKTVFRNGFVTWLLFLTARTAIAQPLPDEAHFNHFSIREGLPTALALQLAQDDQGFIWVATDNGLACFDGVDFMTYHKGTDPINSMPSNAIAKMIKLPNGKIAIATSNGPCLLDPVQRSFKRLKLRAEPSLLASENYLLSACVTANGLVAMGGNASFSLFDQNGNLLFQHHPFPASDVGKVDMAFGQHLLPLDNGDVLIKGWQGLWRYDAAQQKVESQDPAAYGETYETLWTIGRQDWLAAYHFYPDTLRVRNLANGRFGQATLTPAQKKEIHWRSKIVFANDTLLGVSSHFSGFRTAVIDPATMNLRVSKLKIFKETHVFDYLMDKEGRWWFGTETGLYEQSLSRGKLKFTPVELTKASNGEPLIISSIFKLNGQYFVGTTHYGLWRTDENLQLKERLPLSNNASIILWLHSHEPGILDVCTKDGWVRAKVPEMGDGPPKTTLIGPKEYVYAQFKDSRGDVWSGYHGGILRYETTTDRSIYYPANQPGDLLRLNGSQSFCETDSGYIWACGPSGLTRWNPFKRRFDKHFDNLPAIADIDAFPKVVVSDGGESLLVVENQNGIWHWEGDDRTATQLFSSSNELDFIFTLKPDPRPHHFWVSQNSGITLIDSRTGRYRAFSSLDGIPNGSYDERIYLDPATDSMYIGYLGGVLRFKRTDLDFPKGKLSIYITEVRQLSTGKALHGGADLHLTQPGNDLSIAFSSPNFEHGKLINYAYRLNGGAWQNLGKTKSVRLVNLPPGEYRFEVKSLAPDGGESAPAALIFWVKPLFHQTWWFVALVAGAGGLAVYGYFRWRLAQLRKMEDMRQAIAADLHDEVGASLTSIQILAQLASHPDAARSAEALGKLPEQVRRTSASLREIVWNISPSHDSLDLLIGELSRHAGEVFEKMDIQYSVHADDFPEGDRLDVAARQHLVRIFKETLNNLAKHSQANRAAVVFKKEGHELVVQVQDNGLGFDPATVRRGNGLDNMQARAAAAGGQLSLRSNKTDGTETTLRLPLQGVRLWLKIFSK